MTQVELIKLLEKLRFQKKDRDYGLYYYKGIIIRNETYHYQFEIGNNGLITFDEAVFLRGTLSSTKHINLYLNEMMSRRINKFWWWFGTSEDKGFGVLRG